MTTGAERPPRSLGPFLPFKFWLSCLVQFEPVQLGWEHAPRMLHSVGGRGEDVQEEHLGRSPRHRGLVAEPPPPTDRAWWADDHEWLRRVYERVGLRLQGLPPLLAGRDGCA